MNLIRLCSEALPKLAYLRKPHCYSLITVSFDTVGTHAHTLLNVPILTQTISKASQSENHKQKWITFRYIEIIKYKNLTFSLVLYFMQFVVVQRGSGFC